MAKAIFPPKLGVNYWNYLEKYCEGFFCMALGRPCFLPENLDIDRTYLPLGWQAYN